MQKENRKVVSRPLLALILTTAFVALVVPNILMNIYGLYWGALSYFIVAVLWATLFPTSYMSGNISFLILAAVIILPGLLVSVYAIGVYLHSQI